MDEGSDSECDDLAIAKRFPQRTTFECERKQSKDCCAHGDHHRSNTLNPGVRKSALQRLSLVMHLFDEVEQHDDMADDDSDEAGNSKECNESEGRAHDC